MITSTALTLVVVPVLYTYLDGFAEWRKARRAARNAARPVAPVADEASSLPGAH